MIEIFIAIDNNFSNHWEHVFNSIKANTKEKISFNIICESDVKVHVSDANINIINVEPQIKQYKKFNLQSTRAIYLRWLIPELTKSDKAVYFDTDVIVLGDVKELWDIDLKDNYIAAVPSYIFKTVGQGAFIQGGCRESRVRSFLSGQLVMNCRAWREFKLKDKMIEFALDNNVLDEAPLSIICNGHIHELSKYWCVPANYISDGYKHSQMLYDYDMKRVKLLHWSGPYKPWIKQGRNHEYYKKYIS